MAIQHYSVHRYQHSGPATQPIKHVSRRVAKSLRSYSSLHSCPGTTAEDSHFIPFPTSSPFPHLHRRPLRHLRPLEHLHLRLHQAQRTLLLPVRIIVRLHRRVAFQVNQRPVLKCQPAGPTSHALSFHVRFARSLATHPFVSPIVRSLPGPSGANDATRNQDV